MKAQTMKMDPETKRVSGGGPSPVNVGVLVASRVCDVLAQSLKNPEIIFNVSRDYGDPFTLDDILDTLDDLVDTLGLKNISVEEKSGYFTVCYKTVEEVPLEVEQGGYTYVLADKHMRVED